MLFTFLRNNPWRNLPETLTKTMPKLFFYACLAYTLALPILVILSHTVSTINVFLVQVIIMMAAFVLCFILPFFLRSGKKQLELQEEKNKGIFPLLYHIVIKTSGIFSVIVFSYLGIGVVMILLHLLTGITQSQEIPDMTHLTTPKILFMALSAGLTEEIWRVTALVVFLALCKKFFSVNAITLLIGILLTSFVFGWLHSFGYSDHYFSLSITLQLGLIGVVLCLITIISRRIWMAIFFHFFYDFVSISIHAKASHTLHSEKALEDFLYQHIEVVNIVGYTFLFGFLCFITSIFLIRFSKGAKKK